MLTTAIESIIFILVCCLFFYFKQDMIKRMFANQLSPQTGELQNQLELTAERVINNLESHITHLEDLLEQADRRIALLDSKLRQANEKTRDDQAPATAAGLPAASPEIAGTTTAAAGIPYGLAQYRQYTNNRLTGAEDTNVPAERQPVETVSQQRSIVLAMFKQGYTDVEIARATGLGRGEIALLLQLHKNI